MTGSFPTTKVLNPDHLDHLRNEGFESDAAINWLIGQGVRSITEEEAKRLGLTYQGKAYAGILFPFTKEFLQVRADNPAVISIKNKRRVCKYISSHGQGVSRAWLPKDSGSGPLVITEGFKDAAAGTYFGEIQTGAIAGVSHWRTALLAQGIKPDVILYDADAAYNDQVLQQLLQAGKALGCKIQFVPEVTGSPKAGISDWLKTQSDQPARYRTLIESALRPEDLLEAILMKMLATGDEPNPRYLRGIIRIAMVVFGPSMADTVGSIMKRARWVTRDDLKRIHLDLANRQYRAKHGAKHYTPSTEGPGEYALARITAQKDLIYFGGAWWRWNGNYWDTVSNTTFNREFQDMLFKAWRTTDRVGLIHPYANCRSFDDAIRVVRQKIAKDDLSSKAIVFKNGTLYPYLRHFKADTFIKEDHCSRFIDFDYAPGREECPEALHTFLVSSYGEDIVPIIQAVIWLLMNPTAPYDKFIWLIGNSGTGKGVLLKFLRGLFPRRTVTLTANPRDLATAEKRHQILSGRNLCIFPDVRGVLKDLDSFYGLVENDELTGRALYDKDAYSIRWGCRFLMASATVLQTDHGNDGLRRRALVIPTKEKLDVAPDPFLKERLKECSAEAISWALSMDPDLALAVLSSPEEFSERIEAASDLVASSIDSLGSFVDSCLQACPEGQISVNTLHECFKAYCKVAGYSPLNIKNFSSRFKAMLGTEGTRFREQGKLCRGYQGLRLVPDLFKTVENHYTGSKELICNPQLQEEGNLKAIKQAFGIRF